MLWIWRTFFGSPGGPNGLNVLGHSKTMNHVLAEDFPLSFPYKVNGTQRNIPYYLAHGIYPCWAIFVKKIKKGATKCEKNFAKAQEAVRCSIPTGARGGYEPDGRIRCARGRVCPRVEGARGYCSITTDGRIRW